MGDTKDKLYYNKKNNYIDVYNILISIATILLESSLSMEQSRLGAVFKLLNSYV